MTRTVTELELGGTNILLAEVEDRHRLPALRRAPDEAVAAVDGERGADDEEHVMRRTGSLAEFEDPMSAPNSPR